MVQVIPAAETFGSTFGRNLGAGLGQGLSDSIQRRQRIGEQLDYERALQGHKYNLGQQEKHRIKETFLKAGVDPDKAELYSNLSVGGQTAFVKKLLEEEERGGKSFTSPDREEVEMNGGETVSEEPQEGLGDDLSKYLSNRDKGLKPSEKVAIGKQRFDTGIKKYEEAGSKLRGLTRDMERLDILEHLNKSKKLPSDWGRFNVDSEGNLRFPNLAGPESERYIKTLNEFSANAKDTYGSRVTNFDLSQYMKRHPTLLNSEEGRKQITQQMKLFNDINAVYYKNLKKVYDRAGGVRNIDSDVAERFAEQMSDKTINNLSRKFINVGKPDPMKNKGRIVRDDDTGERFISNGEYWEPVEEGQ